MTVRHVKDRDGERVELWDPWSPADVADLARSRATRVVLQGFGGKVLPPIELPPNVEELVVGPVNITSDGAVAHLTHLRRLYLATYAQDKIDFGRLARLEALHFYWRPGGETAFAHPGLTSLGVRHYPFPDLEPLRAMTQLRELLIGNTRRIHSLAGIEALPALETLQVIDVAAPLDVAALAAGSRGLRFLQLASCSQLRSVEAIGSLDRLEKLDLNDTGKIPSIRALAHLSALRTLYLAGTTNIVDGDLSPLFALPALEELRIGNRRHYSPGGPELEQSLIDRYGRFPRRPGDPRW